uniref:Transposase n=1 Tax=Steinernema glaseri TaxID=37863 RepID=A0A1I7Y7Q2_9BILA
MSSCFRSWADRVGRYEGGIRKPRAGISQSVIYDKRTMINWPAYAMPCSLSANPNNGLSAAERVQVLSYDLMYKSFTLLTHTLLESCLTQQ